MRNYDEIINNISVKMFAEDELVSFYEVVTLGNTSKNSKKITGYSYRYFKRVVIKTTNNKFIIVCDTLAEYLKDSQYASYIMLSDGKKQENFTKIYIDNDYFELVINFALKKMYEYCKEKIPSDFDCCSRYEKCSNAKKCIQPDKELNLLCSYRKKVQSGTIFFGSNRNV